MRITVPREVRGTFAGRPVRLPAGRYALSPVRGRRGEADAAAPPPARGFAVLDDDGHPIGSIDTEALEQLRRRGLVGIKE